VDQAKTQWWDVVNTLMNLRVTWHENFKPVTEFRLLKKGSVGRI